MFLGDLVTYINNTRNRETSGRTDRGHDFVEHVFEGGRLTELAIMPKPHLGV